MITANKNATAAKILGSSAMKFRNIILSITTLIFLAGCNSSVTPITSSSPPAKFTPYEMPYVVGSGDQLDIRVWRNPELSVSVPVRPDGIIAIPLAGEVEAAGKTTKELTDEITSKLSEYLKQPTVTVIVTDTSSTEFTQRVRVTGAVASPLSIPWREGMTVLDLVLQAGGTTEFANENNARLVRKTASGIEVYPVHLEDILKLGKLDTNYSLAPSDIITVPE